MRHVAKDVLEEKLLIDVRVAEEVMGWTLNDYMTNQKAGSPEDYQDAMINDGWTWEGHLGEAWEWAPSTNIKHAKIVQDHLQEKGFYLSISDMRHGEYWNNKEEPFKGYWAHVTIVEKDSFPTEVLYPGIGAETEELLICKVALQLADTYDL